jgi:peroxiredoxin
MPLKPRESAPPLIAALVGGGTYTLGKEPPDNFSLVVFFRGLHCPVCNAYLNTLQSLLPDFAKRGVEVIALSMEAAQRSAQCKTEWGLDQLQLGHSIDEATAREWGLYLTAQRKDDEPALFTEPGLFIIERNGILSSAVINTGPRLRPDLHEVLALLDRRLSESMA